ncbi:MAG: carbohydrate kinase family protein [Candidatus Paceibacterota bacterium]|jgi:sugar/nucleoside kinase (ribokinase family)
MNKIDFLAIGDSVVDVFIRLSMAEEVVDVNHDTRKLCMAFGDKIPYEFDVVVPGVGNSPNAAVAIARLGQKSFLLSNIGDDDRGKDCLEVFHQNGVETEFIKIHQGKKTNYHYVLWFHNERTILIKHEEYSNELPEIGQPKWIYLSSLSKNSLIFHKMLEEYLEKNPGINLAFQPGTFQMSLGTTELAGIYKHSKIFFCNVEEAKRILKIEADIKVLLVKMSEIGPKIVVITDGPKGSYAYDSESNKTWFMPPYPDPKEPYERTGAGDAFSSTFTGAILLGKSVPEALAWGSINSMSVVQYIGAQEGLLSQEKIQEYIDKKPEGFEVKEI